MKRPNPNLDGKKFVQLQRKRRANPSAMQRSIVDKHLAARFARVIGRSQRTDGDHRLAMTAASIAAVRAELLFAGCRFLQHGHTSISNIGRWPDKLNGPHIRCSFAKM